MQNRPVFPVRYYIIDFEFSIRFPEDSDPKQRLVTGLPILRNGFDHPDDYGREIAPEMLLDKPHCPFKSDIFQLGKLFFDYFHLLESDYPDLIKIFRSMIEHDPSCRPTAAEALKSVHEYHDGFTRAQLKGPVPEPDLSPMPFSQMVKRTHEANARQAAREQKHLEAELAKASVTSS
ncbi:hypothetical protein PILCRDRAFT_9613 [Piloderma croceum F 1598]|uniref:Protein kinase domain-containing protein n=1 Tax=Piloderma croceum (strain F 1598) TaxID=765440 RepID=A0A0C3B2J2_PILCF|nr:hypothetical protein PILCRDRAFT_9613 [Piloderma croceum F 1598]